MRGRRRLARPIWRAQARIQLKVDIHDFATQWFGGVLTDNGAIASQRRLVVVGGWWWRQEMARSNDGN
jgi:hypothetical protein